MENKKIGSKAPNGSFAPRTNQYLSLLEASQVCPYSQEYLSLRARQSKLKAVKLGRNWVTTQEWLTEYIKQVQTGEVVEQVETKFKEIEREKLKLREITVGQSIRLFGQGIKWLLISGIPASIEAAGHLAQHLLEYIGQSIEKGVAFILRAFSSVILSVSEESRRISTGFFGRWRSLRMTRKNAVSTILVLLLILGSIFTFSPSVRGQFGQMLADIGTGVLTTVREMPEQVSALSCGLQKRLTEVAGHLAQHLLEMPGKIPGILAKTKTGVLTKVRALPGQISALSCGFRDGVAERSSALTRSLLTLASLLQDKVSGLPDKNEQVKLSLKSQAFDSLRSLGQYMDDTRKGVADIADILSDVIQDVIQTGLRLSSEMPEQIPRLKSGIQEGVLTTVRALPGQISRLSFGLQKQISTLSRGLQNRLQNGLANFSLRSSEAARHLAQHLLEMPSKMPGILADLQEAAFTLSLRGADIVHDEAIPWFSTGLPRSLRSLAMTTGEQLTASIFNPLQQLTQRFQAAKDYTASKLGDAYIKVAEYLIPGYRLEPELAIPALIKKEITKIEAPIIQEIVKQVQEITPKEIIKEKEIITEKEVEKVTEKTIESADLTELKQDIDILSLKISDLDYKIKSKIDYTVPAYAPVYIPSTGLQVSGHALLSTLNVSGSGAIGGSLGVGGNTGFGDPNKTTDTMDVYSTATFHEAATFQESVTASKGLSVSGANLSVGSFNVNPSTGNVSTSGTLTAATTTLATTTISQLTVSGNATTTGNQIISGNLLVSGNATTTGSQAFSSTVSVADILTATSTQILATTTDAALTVRQNSTGHIADFKDGSTSVLTIADGGILTINASSTSPIINLTASSTDTHLLFKLAGAGPLLNITDNTDTSKFYINNSGNLGLATTSPLALLDVYGNAILSGANRYLTFGDAAGSSGYGFRDNAGTVEFRHSADAVWSEVGSGGGGAWEQIWLGAITPTTTDAGIFVTASSTIATLRVDDFLRATTSLDFWLNATTTLDLTTLDVTNLTAAYATSSSRLVVGSTQPTTNDIFWVGGNTYLYGSATTTGSYYIAGTASTTQLFVQGTGHIGGNATIDGTLAVLGATTLSGNLNITGYASTTAGLFTQASGHFGGDLTIDGSATTSGSFYVGTSDLVVQDGGNVGIGTTTPNYKLSVAGQIYATSTSNQLILTNDLTNSAYTNFSVASDGDMVIDLGTDTATTTFSDNVVISGNLGGSSPLDIVTDVITYGRATTTDRLVLGTTQPTTNDMLWVGGNTYLSGHATTTGSLSAGQLAVGSAYWFPASDGNANQVLKTDGSGNLTWLADTDTTMQAWQYIWSGAITPTTTSAGIFVTASSTIQNALRIDGNATTTGSFTTKNLIINPDTSQAITASTTTILSGNTINRISSNADYVMISTPTIASSTDGHILILKNTGSYTIELQDNSVLSGSGVFHEGTNGTLAAGEMMTLVYIETAGGWIIQSHPNSPTNVPSASSLIDVRNTSGSTITAGVPVYITGYNVGQGRIEIGLADADDPLKMPSIGLTTASIANNGNGTVIANGILEGINTSAYSVGDGLYVDTTAGDLTNVRPSVDYIQRIGTVSRANANGSIMVVGAGRSNDVPQNFSFTTATSTDRLVLGTTNPTTDNDLLWVGGNTYLSGSATTTGSFYVGTSDLVVQDGGNVGIGTTTPNYKLSVVGQIYATSTSNQLILTNDLLNSAYTNFSVASDGDMVIDLGTDTATTTFNENVVISGNLGGSSPLDIVTDTIIYGSATTTDRLVLGTTQPTTNDIFWVGGNTYLSGSATTTGSFYVGTSDLVVQDGGNVGIGTTTPDYKLSVVGQIYATSTSNQLILTNDLVNSAYATFSLNNSGDLTIDLAATNATTTFSDSVRIHHTVGTGKTLFRVASSTAEILIVNSDGNVGIGTAAPAAKLDVDGSIIFNKSGVSTADFVFGSSQLGDTGVAAQDARFWFDKSKGAFRAGFADSTQWDDGNVGTYSVAMGYRTTASGHGSLAMGGTTLASGEYGFAIGRRSTASGDYSVAMGGSTNEAGTASTASGNFSFSMGEFVEAGANNAFVLGKGAAYNQTLTNSIASSLIIGFDSTVPTFFVDGSNVGIGTTTPDYKLSVVGQIYATSTSNQLILTNDLTNSAYTNFSVASDGDMVIDLGTDTATTTFNENVVISGNLGGSSPLDIVTDVITYGRATTTDRLVLGTTQPTTNDIFWVGGNTYLYGSATTTGSYYIAGTASTTELFVQGAAHAGGNTTIDGTLAVSGASTLSSNLDITGYASTTAGLFTQSDAHIGGNLTIDGNATTSGALSAGGVLYVQQDTGRVGIGTTAPTSTLQVSGGDVHFQKTGGNVGLYWDESTGLLGIGTTSPDVLLHLESTSANGQLDIGYDWDSYANFAVDSNGDLTIDLNTTNATTTFADNVVIQGNLAGSSPLKIIGNVGIGTTTPYAKLSITGNRASTTPIFAVASSTQTTLFSIGHDGNVTINTDSSSGPVTYSGTGKPKRSIILTASGAISPTSAGAAQTKVDGTNHTYYVLDFDASTDESAYWHWVIPDSYDAGNINVTVYWFAAAVAGDVVWAVQTVGVDDGEAYDATLGTAQTATDTAKGTANQLNSAAITAFSPGWAAEDEIIFKVYRDADSGSDDMTGDARLVKIKIEYSVSQETD